MRPLLLLHERDEPVYVSWHGQDITTKRGTIKSTLVEKSIGKHVKTHLGEEYLLLEASLRDRIQRMPKGARPIYEYDAGIICALLSLEPGKTVIEAGTGSGCLTLFMSNVLGEKGKVYTFELEERFYDVAKKNLIERKNVILKNADIMNAKLPKSLRVDAIMLDMMEPTAPMAKLDSHLKLGGFFGVFTPIMDDIKPVYRKFEELGYTQIRAMQLDMKEITVKKYARVEGLYGFPGFIIFGRKFR